MAICDTVTEQLLLTTALVAECVMELHWDYDYYQLWTDNKWIVEEIIVIRDEGDKDDIIDNVSAHQG